MMPTDTLSRARILARIRAGLDRPAPRHAGGGPQEIFAPVGDPLDRFQRECAINGTECAVVPGWVAGSRTLAALIESLPSGEIYLQDAPLTRRLMEKNESTRAMRWSSDGAPRESSQATITLAEALVADTGSVFVASSGGGRAGSIIAPVHIVLAEVSQLALNLEGAFARLRSGGADRANSMLCLITGSSRTGDIEKILVMGAHGPRRLVVVLSQRTE
ncbi:MAG: LUD domain-containing protein [Candidatus Acidiferrales bacterium]